MGFKIKNFFGVEIEINSFDGKSKPDDAFALPTGSKEVALLVSKASNEVVVLSSWCNNHGNNRWFVKPDSSCGIEICSPVLKGRYGASRLYKVVSALKSDSRVKSDSRCSFHVHFDVSTFSEEEILSIITWWIKLESFFMNIVPRSRKVNPYCRLIAQSNIVGDVSVNYDLEHFINSLGQSKYYSLNSYHYYNKRRKTLEFRIMDGSCCVNPKSAVCWVYLIDHFISCCVSKGLPPKFEPGNPWSGLCWLDPLDAFSFLGMCSEGIGKNLASVRSWLIRRLSVCCFDCLDFGVFTKEFRKDSFEQVRKLEELFSK